MSGHQQYTPVQLDEASRSVVWWPAALALLIVGLGYSLVSQLLTIGPPWLILVAVVLASAAIYILRWRGQYRSRRIVALAILSIVTVALGASAVFLLVSPKVEDVPPVELLRDAMLLWASNILTFGLWYWETDRRPGSRLFAVRPRAPTSRFPHSNRPLYAETTSRNGHRNWSTIYSWLSPAAVHLVPRTPWSWRAAPRCS